ncbi:MAG TPA: FHA domain-containing protein [Pirellulales bacterium]|nr:FHA domain-containing protein [Pirellulales bacterium]
MEAKLVLVAEDGRSGEYKLRLPLILGRSRQAGLTVLHTSVSRQHCELSEYEGQLVANDLGSLNGTFIEETRISEPTILPDGGLLRVGSVSFHAVYGSGASAPPPPAAALSSAPAEIPLAPAAGESQPEAGERARAAADSDTAGDEDADLDFLTELPQTEELEPLTPGDQIEEELDELIELPDDAAPAEADPMEFLTLEEEESEPAMPTAAASPQTPPPKPSAPQPPAPKPAPVAGAAENGTNESGAKPASGSPPGAAKPPPAADDETLSFLPPASDAETDASQTADEAHPSGDLDSFFDSLQ